MRLKHTVSTSDIPTRPALFNVYSQEPDVLEDAIEGAGASRDILPGWLPTARAYIVWTFCASVAWEIASLPLSSAWVTENLDRILLFAIRAINVDLIIALGAFISILVILADDQWPRKGYRRVAAWTIVFGFCFSAMYRWISIDDALQNSSPLRGSNFVEDAVAQIKWIFIPVLAFWQARGAAQTKARHRYSRTSLSARNVIGRVDQRGIGRAGTLKRLN
jgi:hypothetical protein